MACHSQDSLCWSPDIPITFHKDPNLLPMQSSCPLSLLVTLVSLLTASLTHRQMPSQPQYFQMHLPQPVSSTNLVRVLLQRLIFYLRYESTETACPYFNSWFLDVAARLKVSGEAL